jgi:endonuclease-3 related protein
MGRDVEVSPGRSGQARCLAEDRPFVPQGDSGPLAEVYERLLGAYGPQHWWPGETAFEVIVGAILTQSAAWANVEKALANLKDAGALSPEGLHSLDEGEIARLIRPSGYFNAKARKLKALVEMLHSRFGGERGRQVKTCPPGDELDRLLAMPMEELRALLLSTHGIGPETADSIVLYAAEQPSFVIDAYTRRIFSRIGVQPGPAHGADHPEVSKGERGYEAWRRLFMEALPAVAPMFNEYHALIVAHGKRVCRKAPLCEECALREVCEMGRASTPA